MINHQRMVLNNFEWGIAQNPYTVTKSGKDRTPTICFTSCAHKSNQPLSSLSGSNNKHNFANCKRLFIMAINRLFYYILFRSIDYSILKERRMCIWTPCKWQGIKKLSNIFHHTTSSTAQFRICQWFRWQLIEEHPITAFERLLKIIITWNLLPLNGY